MSDINSSQSPRWAAEIMARINKLTPDVKGKAFDPDWFLLRERLEEAEQTMCGSSIEQYVRANYPNEDVWKLIMDAVVAYKPQYQELKQFELNLQIYTANNRRWDYDGIQD